MECGSSGIRPPLWHRCSLLSNPLGSPFLAKLSIVTDHTGEVVVMSIKWTPTFHKCFKLEPGSAEWNAPASSPGMVGRRDVNREFYLAQHIVHTSLCYRDVALLQQPRPVGAECVCRYLDTLPHIFPLSVLQMLQMSTLIWGEDKLVGGVADHNGHIVDLVCHNSFICAFTKYFPSTTAPQK